MPRKTADVEAFKAMTNQVLRVSTVSPDLRKGWMAALEWILHETGNYRDSDTSPWTRSRAPDCLASAPTGTAIPCPMICAGRAATRPAGPTTDISVDPVYERAIMPRQARDAYMQMYTGTIEAELVNAIKRMGYGVDINNLRGKVTVNTGSGKKKDDHVFKNATLALMWVEAQERTLRSFGR